MRRAGMLLSVAVLVAGLASCSAEPTTTTGSWTLGTATLDAVHAVSHAPRAKFTRTMFATVRLGPSPMMLDLCRGPIAIDLGRDRPVLVAEHDYCGGTAWIPKLGPGDAVELRGNGVVPGTYVVTGTQTERRGEAQVKDLPAADVVLQTCISPGELVLVAANRFVPAVIS